VARLAADAGVEESAMRKRLQRIRDTLRREIEMAEQREMHQAPDPGSLSERILELLARPRLTDLPENPVGRTQGVIRSVFAECRDVELPEILDFAESQKTIGNDALYIDPQELHFVDDRRILRYDLTLPLLLNTRFEGRALRLWSVGKVYRHCATDATHLDAFHQAEVFWMDDRARIDPWRVAGLVLESVTCCYQAPPCASCPRAIPCAGRPGSSRPSTMDGAWRSLRGGSTPIASSSHWGVIRSVMLPSALGMAWSGWQDSGTTSMISARSRLRQ
jgi:hypothetical protein